MGKKHSFFEKNCKTSEIVKNKKKNPSLKKNQHYFDLSILLYYVSIIENQRLINDLKHLLKQSFSIFVFNKCFSTACMHSYG